MGSPGCGSCCSFGRGFSSAANTSDLHLRGSAVWDGIPHPPALLPLLHSKQLQPAALSFILSFKALSQGFQQGRKFSLARPVSFCHSRHGCVLPPIPLKGRRKRQLPNPQPCTWKEDDIKEHKIAGNSILPSPPPSSSG